MLQFTCLHANLLDLDSAAALESGVKGCFPGLFFTGVLVASGSRNVSKLF